MANEISYVIAISSKKLVNNSDDENTRILGYHAFPHIHKMSSSLSFIGIGFNEKLYISSRIKPLEKEEKEKFMNDMPGKYIKFFRLEEEKSE